MRRLLRVAKLAIVTTIVFTMTVDTANACRLFRWMFAHRAADCVNTPRTNGIELASTPMAAAPIAHDFVYSDAGCVCGAPVAPFVSDYNVESYAAEPYSIIQSGHDDGYVVEESSVVDTGEVIYEASPADVSPIDNVPVDVISIEEIVPVPDAGGAEPPVAPVENPLETTEGTETTTSDGGATAGAPGEESNLFEGNAAGDSSEDELPTEAPDEAGLGGNVNPPTDTGDGTSAIEAPAAGTQPDAANDLFGGDEAPAAGNDLFGGDEAPAAGTEADTGNDLFGGDEAPAAGNDLFGGDEAPAAGTEPDTANDLFGGDEAPAAGNDLFGGDEAPAAGTEPDAANDLFGGDEAPAAGNDLFGGDEAPAGEAADEAPDGNLFEENGDEAPAGNDLFEETPTGDDESNGLFGENSDDNLTDTVAASSEAPVEVDTEEDLLEEVAPPAVEEPPVEADSTLEEEEESDLDDLFGQNGSDGMRTWTDNTGTYRTIGRLVVIAKTHVRLLKDNGRYSTVPLERLSNQDLDYVMGVAKKLTGSQRIASR